MNKYNVYVSLGTIEDLCQIADGAFVKPNCSTINMTILEFLVSCDAELVIYFEPFTKFCILG